MKKSDLIKKIEQNLSILLSLLNYREFVIFVRSNKFVAFYDKNIDKAYYNILFTKCFLIKVNEIIKNKIQSV